MFDDPTQTEIQKALDTLCKKMSNRGQHEDILFSGDHIVLNGKSMSTKDAATLISNF